MTTYRARPIDPAALKELRDTDDAGRPLRPYASGADGEVLRCCLRLSTQGERIALVSYAPLRRWAARTGADPGAYDEQGPVFIHADECAGPDGAGPDGAGTATVYPFARPGALRAFRRYDARGRIAGGRMAELPFDTCAAYDAALDEAFADPEVALVHVRAVEYGCLHFEVRRP
ncbi:DUF1203 domain-containing protein [Streptomyces armeniacus]|uniref:DUF1203 domain-containing protein n=1 Tax=Streptomyces armeniacus TaxID=83291 RepID=A0A345XRG3_9ACTN|nr:DUF1203 domain-containing protein [Streptomyces armeniacus]AXK34229.1 DUF1203 domain-containing protein [Streptomyces armeniacus]